MAARQSEATTKALRWLGKLDIKPNAGLNQFFYPSEVKKAAKKFGVHESTLWRALGKQKSK